MLAPSEVEGLCPRCLIELAGRALDPPPALHGPGDRIGPYEIVALLSRGGMGEVYRAVDTRLDRTVAVKLLSPDVFDTAAHRDRFEREARAVSSLNHPRICTLYDVGEQEGTPFLVMEYVIGQTLAERLEGGALSTESVIRYALEIADALDHAHRHGVVHRDLKPANVMLTPAGVKLLDFGVARLEARQEVVAGVVGALPPPGRPITQDGALVGTLQYMAPEQLDARGADARSDIFSFGAVVHEMATGQPAFSGSSRDGAPCTPGPLDRIVSRCLADSRDDRWQTVHDLKEALLRISEPRRGAGRFVAGAAAIAALGAVALTMIPPRQPAPDARMLRFTVPPPEDGAFSQSSAFAAVSPDGHSLVFVASSKDGRNAIWVRSLDSLNARPIPGTEGGSQPFWSPDGRFVMFGIAGTIDTLKKVAVAGGAPETIDGSRAAPGAWSQDGVVLFPGGPQHGGVVYQVSSSGGTPTPVTSLDRARAETNHGWPHFLPDGRRFLFLARSNDPEHDGVIHAGSLDSPDRTYLVKTDSHAIYVPQGYLLFMRVNTLLAQRFDPQTLRLSGEPVAIAEQVERTPGSFRGAFSVSSTGVLAYRSIAETQLAWYDRAGRPFGSINPPGPFANPALSPDEQRIAVGRLDSDTGTSDIWVIDANGLSAPLRFTNGVAPDEMPLWSPDGSRIVFKSRTGVYERIASGGKDDALLEDIGAFGNPLDWSADGRWLIYQAADQRANLDLWMLPPGGGKPVVALQTRHQEGQARLSPDGRWLAYVSNESGRNEIYVRTLSNEQQVHRVSVDGGLEPRWRGDGRELFYLALDRSLMSVAIRGGAALDAGPPERLFATRMSPVFNPSYTRNQYVASRDGQRFLINQPAVVSTSPPITVVVNWLELLRQWGSD
jgi:serine/threonine protein kinase